MAITLGQVGIRVPYNRIFHTASFLYSSFHIFIDVYLTVFYACLEPPQDICKNYGVLLFEVAF